MVCNRRYYHLFGELSKLAVISGFLKYLGSLWLRKRRLTHSIQ